MCHLRHFAFVRIAVGTRPAAAGIVQFEVMPIHVVGRASGPRSFVKHPAQRRPVSPVALIVQHHVKIEALGRIGQLLHLSFSNQSTIVIFSHYERSGSLKEGPGRFPTAGTAIWVGRVAEGLIVPAVPVEAAYFIGRQLGIIVGDHEAWGLGGVAVVTMKITAPRSFDEESEMVISGPATLVHHFLHQSAQIGCFDGLIDRIGREVVPGDGRIGAGPAGQVERLIGERLGGSAFLRFDGHAGGTRVKLLVGQLQIGAHNTCPLRDVNLSEPQPDVLIIGAVLRQLNIGAGQIYGPVTKALFGIVGTAADAHVDLVILRLHGPPPQYE